MKSILPWVLILFGILFTVVGVKILYTMWLFRSTAIKTTATVIEIKTGLSKAKNTTYSPVLSFKTIDGKDIIYDVNRYYLFAKYTIGQQIEVLYQRENPDAPQVNSFKQIFLPGGITIFLGLFGIGMAIYLFYKK